ncbi:type II secretion system minor pseudopilin [Endothiovibrio diazotrophicus]
MAKPRPIEHAERGAALLVALLAAAILSLLAGSMITLGRQQVERNALLEQRLLLELRADGALAEATYRLGTGQPLFPTAQATEDGEWWTLPLAHWAIPDERGVPQGGGTLRFRIVALSGKLNPLNPLVPGEFRRYLEARGVEPKRAAAIAAELADWTEGDRLRHLNGAVDADYRAAGLPYRPRGDRLLQDVAELRLLRSMDEPLYRRIAPELTLDRFHVVDVDGMPEARLRALAGEVASGGSLAARDSTEAVRAWLAALRHVNSEVILSRGGGDLVRIEVEASAEPSGPSGPSGTGERHGRVGRWLELNLKPETNRASAHGHGALADDGRERPWTVLRRGVL